MGHWCDFCQMWHSTASCFHPGRRLLASLGPRECYDSNEQLRQRIAELETEVVQARRAEEMAYENMDSLNPEQHQELIRLRQRLADLESQHAVDLAAIDWEYAQRRVAELEAEAVQARRAELEATSRWIPVEEGLPPDEYAKDGVEIILESYGRRTKAHGWYDSEAGQWHHYYHGWPVRVTHWLRLPPIPKREEDE